MRQSPGAACFLNWGRRSGAWTDLCAEQHAPAQPPSCVGSLASEKGPLSHSWHLHEQGAAIQNCKGDCSFGKRRSPSSRSEQAVCSQQLQTGWVHRLFHRSSCICKKTVAEPNHCLSHTQVSLKRLWVPCCQDCSPREPASRHSTGRSLGVANEGSGCTTAHTMATVLPQSTHTTWRAKNARQSAKLKHSLLGWKCSSTHRQETRDKRKQLAAFLPLNQSEKMSKWQLKWQCLKKRGKWVEHNFLFSFKRRYMSVN